MTTSTVVSAVKPANGAQLRYRLDVIGSDVGDVVRSVGGWLFDRVLAGWQVNVLLPFSGDARALQILGVRTLDIESELGLAVSSVGLAVGANAFAVDPRIRDTVLKALDRSLTEVTVWGQDWPLNVGRATTPVHHLLSTAARVFKGHALAAAGIPSLVGPTETLRSDMKTCLPVDSELIPAE